jgi:hypothetical protein
MLHVNAETNALSWQIIAQPESISEFVASSMRIHSRKHIDMQFEVLHIICTNLQAEVAGYCVVCVRSPYACVVSFFCRFTISTSEIYMVSDRLDTDILFVQNSGCKTLLVPSHTSPPTVLCFRSWVFPLLCRNRALHTHTNTHTDCFFVLCLHVGSHSFSLWCLVGVTILETLQSPNNFIQMDAYTTSYIW